MKRHILPIFFITIISIAIYANTLKNGFVYDDVPTIVDNTFIKDFNNLPLLFRQDYFNISGELSYRPVVTFTYFIDYALFGLRPWGFHLTNILLHTINGMLLYVLLVLLIRSEVSEPQSAVPRLVANPPFLVSILFATHPVLTEAVNAISFREDLLVFLFYMASLCLYLILRSGSTINHKPLNYTILYSLSYIAYSLALFSKEMAVTLPLIVYCYEWVYKDGKNGLRLLFNRHNTGYIAIMLIYLFLRFYYFYNPSESGLYGSNMVGRVLTVPWLLISYLKLSIFPISLSADYEVIAVRVFSSLFVLPLIAIVSLLTIILILRKKDRGICFGILFFVLTLVPVYNIIPIANPLAERYLYLPAVGFTIIMGLAVHYIFKSIDPGYKVLTLSALISFLILLIIFSLTVVSRNRVWRDDFSLWSDTVRKMPNNSDAHYGLGTAHAGRGEFDKAVQEFQTAVRLNPSDLRTRLNLGTAYRDQGKFGEAIQEFNTILMISPEEPDVHYQLANAYNKQGRLDEAIHEYSIAIKLNPIEPEFYIRLGLAYSKQGRFDEAIQEFEAALKLDPRSVAAHYNLGVTYIRKDLINLARTELEITLKLNPDYMEARKAIEDLDRQKRIFLQRK